MTTTLENPTTRERILLHEGTPDLLRIEEQVPVEMIRPPVHVHLHQQERFEILEGQATVDVDGREHALGPGDSIAVAPGTPHTWWNSGDGQLRMLTEFTPAGNMLDFFETYCGFAAEGRADGNGAPPFLQIALSCKHWDMYLAKPPIPVQKALFAVLAPVARLKGYRTSYDRFRVGGADR
jgi:mannose-6-phosphate isomerase-like protein (cupin superfamily)